MAKPTGVNASKIGQSYLKLTYKAVGASGSGTEIEGVQDFPGFANDRDTVEVTTFADEAHVYIAGIKNFGDALSFTVLHDKANFATFKAAFDGSTQYEWTVSFPDDTAGAAGTTATWQGSATIGIASVSVNGVMTDTLKIIPSTAITFA